MLSGILSSRFLRDWFLIRTVLQSASGSAVGGCAFRLPLDDLFRKRRFGRRQFLPWLRGPWTAVHRLRDVAEFGSPRISPPRVTCMTLVAASQTTSRAASAIIAQRRGLAICGLFYRVTSANKISFTSLCLPFSGRSVEAIQVGFLTQLQRRPARCNANFFAALRRGDDFLPVPAFMTMTTFHRPKMR